jgi:hypothetical protein
MPKSLDIDRMVIPETILASQWVRSCPQDGEHRLCLAILMEALLCLNMGATSDSRRKAYQRTAMRLRLAEEAHAWFMSDSEDVFSFRYICLALGIEPTWIRERLEVKV